MEISWKQDDVKTGGEKHDRGGNAPFFGKRSPTPDKASRCRSTGFLGLVVIAQAKHPVPSRTRQLSAVAPMVLRLKAWESRSPPNLVSLSIISRNDDINPSHTINWAGLMVQKTRLCKRRAKRVAGWSSSVARQAHNLKVVGSNPTPATNFTQK